MKAPHTNPEKEILKECSFDHEVTINGKSKVSRLAQRVIASVYSESDFDDPLAYNNYSHRELRERVCKTVPKTRKKEALKPAIREAIDNGLLYERQPYEEKKKSFGYAITNRFRRAEKLWTSNPRTPDFRDYSTKMPSFDWHGTKWNMEWLTELSFDESVINLLKENRDNPRRLNRLAYDILRVLKRKHYIAEGNTNRISMLTNQICSELRKHLTYKGERLVEGDIKTCHPTLLALLYKRLNSPEAAIEHKSFIQFIQNPENDFYSIFMSDGDNDNAKRDRAKKSFNSWLNGSDNLVTFEALHERFPLLAKSIKSCNDRENEAYKKRKKAFRIKNKLSSGKAHRRYKEDGMRRVVGCVIQKLEAQIVCRKCFKYALENGKLFLPIHDGFQCLPEDYELFSNMIVEGFEHKAGVSVRVEMTPDTKNFMQSMKAAEQKQ